MKKTSGYMMWNGLRLDYAGISHTGLVRKLNEDDFLIMPEYGLFCVADGMGGHTAGDVASRLTLESIANYMDSINPETDVFIADAISAGPVNSSVLSASIQHANKMVNHEAAGRMMGSTIVASHFTDHLITLNHVGDSRIYLFKEGQLTQLTEDHSLVNDLYLQGHITREEMWTHPQRNVITRAIGTATEVEVSSRTLVPEADSLLLLCSDGLTGMLQETEISALLNVRMDTLERCEALVKKAIEAGGRDNITILIISIR